MHSDQFKPKSYLKLIKKYVFSEGEQFPLIALLRKMGAWSVKFCMQPFEHLTRLFLTMLTSLMKVKTLKPCRRHWWRLHFRKKIHQCYLLAKKIYTCDTLTPCLLCLYSPSGWGQSWRLPSVTQVENGHKVANTIWCVFIINYHFRCCFYLEMKTTILSWCRYSMAWWCEQRASPKKTHQ